MIRLFRIFKIYTLNPDLGVHGRAMMGSLKPVTYLLVFQNMQMYLLALLLVNWSRSSPELLEASPELYATISTVSRTMSTLLQFLIVDNVFYIVNLILPQSWYFGLILLVYFAVATLVTYNILIGSICRTVDESTTREEDRVARESLERILADKETLTSKELKDMIDGGKFKSNRTNPLDADQVLSAAELVADTDTINTKDLVAAYLKFSHPLEAQDLIACQTGLEQLYMSISSTLHEPIH